MKYSKYLFLLLSIVMISCESPLKENGNLCPDDDFQFGSEDLELSGAGLTDNTVDISQGSLNIKAEFSEEVTWRLNITSAAGKLKTFNGRSQSINENWYGNSDNELFFDEGEASISIDITCKDKVEKKLTVVGKSKFNDLAADFGVLIRDWDKNGAVPVINVERPTATEATEVIGVFAGATWPNGDGYFYNPLNLKSFEYSLEESSPAGGRYLNILGESNSYVQQNGNWVEDETPPEPVWYFGANEMINMQNAFSQLSTNNPDSLYFNFYARGDGEPNTQLEIAFVDDPNTSWIYRWPGNFSEWEFFSIKMSDLLINRGDNPLLDVGDINSIALSLSAGPLQATQGQCSYDFIMVTVGQPFFVNQSSGGAGQLYNATSVKQ